MYLYRGFKQPEPGEEKQMARIRIKKKKAKKGKKRGGGGGGK
jgi:hypothetical protein